MSSDSDDDGYEDVANSVVSSPPAYDSLTIPKVGSPTIASKPAYGSTNLRDARSQAPISDPIATRPPLPPPNAGPKRHGTLEQQDVSRPRLPPKPPTRQPSTKGSTTTTTTTTTAQPTEATPGLDMEGYYKSPDELTLLQLVERHQDQFPLRVHVCKGFYGPSERFSVSEGDIYSIHFVKKARVVLVQDCSKVEYRIALNSSVEFGMLYNPEGNLQKALDGYKFAKISDVMAVSPLPKVIRCTATFKGTAHDNSIEKNELLIVKEVKLRGNRRNLVVYSLTASKVKYLFETCEGHFSTKPYDVRLFLPEILEHVPQPFPNTCYLFINSDSTQDLPHHLVSSAATLVGEGADLSLIASSNCEAESNRALLVEIPVDLDIEVQVMVPKDEADCDKLYEATNDLMENFDAAKVVQCEGAHSKTATLTTPLQPGERKGIELVKSTALRHWSSVRGKKEPLGGGVGVVGVGVGKGAAPSGEQYSHLPPAAPTVASGDATPPPQATPTHKLSGASTEGDRAARDLVSVRADLKRLDTRLSKEMESLKEQVAKMTQSVEQLLHGLGTSSAPPQPDALRPTPPAGQPVLPRPLSADGEAAVRQQNIQYLRIMDTVNMVRLFEMMGLKQYNQTIAQERITGDVLVECTESVLEKELHVESKLHRVRLMKLIDGSHSARGILSGEGPYSN